jgi:hypothetical protein
MPEMGSDQPAGSSFANGTSASIDSFLATAATTAAPNTSPSAPRTTNSAAAAAAAAASGLDVGSFSQPFVPQDLWQMPMTLEWDWADMNGYGGMDGGVGEGFGMSGVMSGVEDSSR